MESMTYQPPLRGAVLFLLGLNQGAVSIETLAEIAQVSTARARAFASILITCKALEDSPQGLRRGKRWDAWSSRPTRSRPHRTSDPAAIADMMAMRRAIAMRVRSELAARGWGVRELARRSGVYHEYIVNLTKHFDTPPACHLICLARALGITVEEMATPMPVSPAQMRG